MNKTSRVQWSQGLLDARAGKPPQEMPHAIAQECSASRLRVAGLFSRPLQPAGPPPVRPRVHLDGAIERALALSDEGAGKVGLLVFCSAHRPGGGWLSGAYAQEEAVALCSTWGLDCFNAAFHQARHGDFFYGDGALMLEGAILAQALGQWLDDPKPAFFAGFASPNMKALREAGGDPASNAKRALEAMRLRCSKALAAFADAGCDAIVLGAAGCGVFEVDPQIAAQAWREALGELGSPFGRIDFAISARPSPSIQKAFTALEREAAPSLAGRRRP